ncbi:hypothetical protein [Natrononativus amylolyticus]|uniref:hypothetical protein n=1 Tax=Natrononativus amylolyticus TaxID=2963434 RepID=UPI0020CC1579|nr:hypothetical protein [Natrononativus amylolyticus]
MKRRALLATLTTGAAAAVAGCADGFEALDSGASNREPYGVDDDEYVDPDPDDDRPAPEDDERALHAALYPRADLVGSEHDLALEVFAVPEDTEELVFELDLGVLDAHGVTLEEPELDVEFVEGDGYDESDGLELAVAGADGNALELTLTTLEAFHAVAVFSLVGFDTSEAGAATDLEYGLSVRDHDAEVRSGTFDLVDLENQSPTVSPRELFTGRETQRQRIDLEWLRPAGEEIRVEIDVTALEEYGSLEETTVDRTEFVGGTVEHAAVEGGIVSLELAVPPDGEYATGQVTIAEMDVSVEEPVEDVIYGVSLEGVVDDDAKVEPFEIGNWVFKTEAEAAEDDAEE